HLDQHAVAQLETRAGDEPCPVEALHGEILADGAGSDGVSLAPERLDVLEGEEAERPLGAAVIPPVALRVTREPELGDGGPRHGMLGHASVGRHVDLRDGRAPAHSATSVPMPCAMARSYARRAVTASSGAHPTDLKSVICSGLARPGFLRVTTSPSS